MRGHLDEIGVVATQGARHACDLKRRDRNKVMAGDAAKRLMTVPGVDPVPASHGRLRQGSEFAGFPA
jgi:hypothetical protein